MTVYTFCTGCGKQKRHRRRYPFCSQRCAADVGRRFFHERDTFDLWCPIDGTFPIGWKCHHIRGDFQL